MKTVTIEKVIVVTGPGECQQYGVTPSLEGSDITASGLSFEVTPVGGAPATGYQVLGNTITVPDTFTTGTYEVDIFVGATQVNNVLKPLLIFPPISCSGLQSSIILGQGEGIEQAAGALPATGGATITFAGTQTSINLAYPSSAILGAMTFNMTFTMDTDLIDRASIISNAGEGIYEIAVRDDGTDFASTASNFAYAINNLLGSNAPVVAVQTGANVLLKAKELGVHTNAYAYTINGNASVTFTGAAASTVLSVPLSLDNTIPQGETNLVYTVGGFGVNNWYSSNPSILEVVPITEAGSQLIGSADFVPETLTVDGTYQVSQGAYSLSDCEEDTDSNDVVTARSCTVNVTLPVEFDITSETFTANVALGSEIVEVDLSGEKLIGTLTGVGEWVDGIGMPITLTGKVTGAIQGQASGSASGSVYGIISTNVSLSANVESSSLVTSGVIQSNFPNDAALIAGTVSPESELTSTVRLNTTDISNFALLYAKRPGKAILTVIDGIGCVAPLSVEVAGQKVILEMVGRDPSDVFDIGETVQINAFVGTSDGQKFEDQNITASNNIDWISSNPNVATVDPTGLMTIVGPGSTNITAQYDTGVVETGTILSDPLNIKVSKISGLTLSLNETTQAKLPSSVLTKAYESILVGINEPQALGKTVTVEGKVFQLGLGDTGGITPVPYTLADFNTELEVIEAIANKLKLDIEADAVVDPLVTVTKVAGFPGILSIEKTAAQDAPGEALDQNGRVDITTTALVNDLTIIPNFGAGINLPASDTYSVMVIGEYDNGRTKRLNPTDVTWVNTPVAYLQQAALETGLLKLDQFTGTSTVYAKFTNADKSVVNSNSVQVTVESGPAIEFVRRIGTGSITKGSRIDLSVKVTDVDTIADISDITVSLVKSNFSTYNEINSDATAQWFTAVPFVEEVEVTEETPPAPLPDGQEAPVVPELQFKTYSIPVEIPQSASLYDGSYKLVISIADASNHTVNAVMPIYVGQIATGDVSGDGQVTMIDVILAFQVASGRAVPTPEQLTAANVNGDATVNMIDVILLFQQVLGR